jgi:uncharacterized protein (TIGR02265 family)
MMGSESSTWGESGLGTQQELLRRLALTTPADTVRGLSFHTALDAVRADLGEAAAERCLDELSEKSFRSFFHYPVSDYLRMLYCAGWMLSERHGGFDNAIRRIAGGIAPGFLASTVGKAFLLLSKEGPRHLINNMPVAYRAAASFGELSLRWMGPRHGVVHTRGDFLLYMNHEGGLLGLFRALELRGARVQGRQVGPLDNEIEFSWGN